MKRACSSSRATRYSLPLDPSLARKFDALRETARRARARSARARLSDARRHVRARAAAAAAALDGLLFYLALPFRLAARAAPLPARTPSSPRARTRALPSSPRAGSRAAAAKLVLDVHGDWRTSRGSTAPRCARALGPLADRVAGVGRAPRGRRPHVSGYTTGLVRELGVEPAGGLPGLHGPRPVPRRAAGSRCRSGRARSSSACSSATRTSTGSPPPGGCAAPRVPGRAAPARRRGDDARTFRERSSQSCRSRRRGWSVSARPGGRGALDESTLLVLPSRSEGMGRVVVEAFCRGRPVLGARVGGIRDLVEDGVNGVLVAPGDTEALADALVRAAHRPRRCVERLAGRARDSAGAWIVDAGGVRRAPGASSSSGSSADEARSSSPSTSTRTTRRSARPCRCCARSRARVDELVVLADGAAPGTLPGELPRADCSPRRHAARPRAPLRARAAGRSCAAPGRRARAHVPDLRRARRAARPPARVRVLLWYTHWQRQRPSGSPSGLQRGPVGRPALVPARVQKVESDRPRHRRERLPVPRAGGQRSPARCSRSAATRPRRATRRADPRRSSRGYPADGARACAHGRGAAPP